jgi:Methyltransferase domain
MNASARRINKLAAHFKYRHYLEIGVLAGTTFLDVEMPERTAVDPGFAFDYKAHENDSTKFFRMMSDDYFANTPFSPAFDIVFIDGFHSFEQVVRDLTNAVLRTHPASIIVLDDTVPDDVYSVINHPGKHAEYRKLDQAPARGWQGDVYKSVFFLHDFWPSLDYRTIVGGGNPQTIVWRANGPVRARRYGDLETISRLTYFDFRENFERFNAASEEEALAACIAGVEAIMEQSSGKG